MTRLSSFFASDALSISTVVLLVSVSYLSVSSFLNNYSLEIGLETFAPWYFIVYAATLLVARPLFGKIMDKKGEHIIMFFTAVVFMVGLILIIHCANAFELLFSAVFLGIGYGSMLPCGQTIVTRQTTQRKISVATSTYYAFIDCGSGLGPIVLGALIPLVGFKGMFTVDIAIVIIAAALYALTHAKQARRAEESS